MKLERKLLLSKLGLSKEYEVMPHPYKVGANLVLDALIKKDLKDKREVLDGSKD
jgi:hypothetical protein